MADNSAAASQLPPEIDTTVPHSARIWNYWLGGKDNYPVDRAAGDQFLEVYPGIADVARASRQFLTRAVRYLAGEAGVRQFLDIGSGIPNGTNVHTVAGEAVGSGARTVYVDNDPIVLAHAHELLRKTPQDAVTYLQGDLRDPEPILAMASRSLDFTRPVAVLLVGILHFFPDTDRPAGIVARLMKAVPSGSYLVVCHLASDIHAEEMAEVARRFNESTNETWAPRTRDEVARFFDGLELVEPGVVQVDEWRPDQGPGPVWPPEDRTNPLLVGVGRKP